MDGCPEAQHLRLASSLQIRTHWQCAPVHIQVHIHKGSHHKQLKMMVTFPSETVCRNQACYYHHHQELFRLALPSLSSETYGHF